MLSKPSRVPKVECLGTSQWALHLANLARRYSRTDRYIYFSSRFGTYVPSVNWQNQLDGVAHKFTSVSNGSQKVIQELENVLRDADEHKEQMYASLKEYKEAIDRAAVEIENIRVAAKKVLEHKSALQDATEKLSKYQKAG